MLKELEEEGAGKDLKSEKQKAIAQVLKEYRDSHNADLIAKIRALRSHIEDKVWLKTGKPPLQQTTLAPSADVTSPYFSESEEGGCASKAMRLKYLIRGVNNAIGSVESSLDKFERYRIFFAENQITLLEKSNEMIQTKKRDSMCRLRESNQIKLE